MSKKVSSGAEKAEELTRKNQKTAEKPTAKKTTAKISACRSPETTKFLVILEVAMSNTSFFSMTDNLYIILHLYSIRFLDFMQPF